MSQGNRRVRLEVNFWLNSNVLNDCANVILLSCGEGADMSGKLLRGGGSYRLSATLGREPGGTGSNAGT